MCGINTWSLAWRRTIEKFHNIQKLCGNEVKGETRDNDRVSNYNLLLVVLLLLLLLLMMMMMMGKGDKDGTQ